MTEQQRPQAVEVKVVLPALTMMAMVWEAEVIDEVRKLIRFEVNVPNISFSNIVTPGNLERLANDLLDAVTRARTGLVIPSVSEIPTEKR